MKSLLSIVITVLVVNVAIAQPKGESPLNATTAGKFAKDLGNKMYNTEPTYGDKHTGYSLNIKEWKPKVANDGKNWYLIKVEISWKEGMGGLGGDWKDVLYKGSIMVDEYGCTPFFFISEQKEPSILGLIKRTEKVTDSFKATLTEVDEWLNNVTYAWKPDGCLED